MAVAPSLTPNAQTPPSVDELLRPEPVHDDDDDDENDNKNSNNSGGGGGGVSATQVDSTPLESGADDALPVPPADLNSDVLPPALSPRNSARGGSLSPPRSTPTTLPTTTPATPATAPIVDASATTGARCASSAAHE